ncbi:MAG: DUF5906 domain-containing protein [Candidatus Hodarchaeota archaeon]
MVGKLDGKMACIVGELEVKTIKNPSRLKALSGETWIEIDEKYSKQGKRFKNQAVLIFATNSLPKIWDKSGVAQTRFVIVDFPNTFIDNPDRNLLDRLTTEEEKSGILNLALRAGMNLLKRGKFTEGTIDPLKLVENYNRKAEPVIDFIENDTSFLSRRPKGVSEDNFLVPIDGLHRIFVQYCKENNHVPVSKISFGRSINNYFGDKVSRIRPKGVYCYKGISYDKYHERIKQLDGLDKMRGN